MIVLTDDGTLDTVLRCTGCGKEFRGTYDGEGMTYDEYVKDFRDEVRGEHSCDEDEEEGRYLVIADGEERIVERFSGNFNYRNVRAVIEARYGPASSPLQAMPYGGRIVTVWISSDKNGVGRIEGNFQEWGVR